MEETEFKGNPEHLEEISKGQLSWNEWRRDNPDIEPELSAADLSSAELNEANLSNVDLSEADLSSAELSGADLSNADLSGAGLSGADLYEADLSEADLSNADLRGAQLYNAVLSEADLSEADLYRANLSGADLRGANLSGAVLSEANLNEADLSNADITGAIWHHVSTFGWKIEGIKCEYLYLTEDDYKKEEDKIKFEEREFEKKHTHIDKIVEMTLKMPLSDISGPTGRFIAESINHLEGSEVVRLKAIEALSDEESKLSFMIFNNCFYTDKKQLVESIQEALNNHIKNNPSLVKEQSEKLIDRVEKITGGALKPRDMNIPFIPYKVDSAVFQKKAVEWGKTIFNSIQKIYNRL